FNFRRLRAKIEGEQGEVLTDLSRHAIAKELNVRYKDVIEMEQRMNGGDHSLNGMIGDDGESEFQDFLADERSNPEQVVTFMKDRATRNKWLASALAKLNDREQHIVTMRSLS